MSVCAPRGWRAAGVVAGTKPSGSLDLALVVSDEPASVAGAFTTNKVQGAPLVVARPVVARGRARALVVSAGIANVATGQAGIEDTERMAEHAARATGVPADEVIVSCTGLIGRRLPLDAVLAGIDAAATGLSPDGADAASRAILTTDAGPKTAVRRLTVRGRTVTVGGMAKGAGMIAPDMRLHATMLAFVTTDGAAGPNELRAVLGPALDRTFNSISVDGCTSTSDTVLVFANGASGAEVGADAGFAEAVHEVLAELAYAVVADGEGASRVVRVDVTGAADETDARTVAREVATSLLVRCAVAGGDPNWGRIAQALGQAPARLDTGRIAVTVAGVPLAVDGIETGRTAEAAEKMRSPEVTIAVDLGLGTGSWTFWSSDLTPDYVRFNAEYTT